MYRFHHVALSVENLERSIAFYHQFGFRQVGQWKPANGLLEIVDLRGSGMVLELFHYPGGQPLPAHSKMPEADVRVHGTKHFALQVASAKAAKQELLAKGMEIVFEDMSDDPHGASYFFVKDPDGILVEIIEDRRGYVEKLAVQP